MIVYDHLRAGLICLQLRAYFLQRRCEIRNCGFQFLHLPVLFEKLVEQHRVHLVVAHAVRFTFFIAYYEIRIHLLNVFRYQAQR
jgi:hypothetical protein